MHTIIRLFLILPLFFSAYAYAQLGEIAGHLTIKDMLHKAQKSAESIIEKAGKEARITIIESAQAMAFVINAANEAYKDSLNTTFSHLDTTLKEQFENTWRTLTQLENTANGVLDHAEDVVVLTTAAIEFMPTVKGVPTITGAAQSYYKESDIAIGDQLIILKGLHLQNGDPTMTIGDTVIHATEKQYRTISFRIPKGIKAENAVGIYSAEVITYSSEGSILSWLGIKDSELKEHLYSIPIFVVPDHMGEISVQWVSEVEKKNYETKLIRCPETGIATNQSDRCTSDSEYIAHRCNIPIGYSYVNGSIKLSTQSNDNCENLEAKVELTKFGWDIKCNPHGPTSGLCEHTQRGKYTGSATIKVEKLISTTKTSVFSPKDPDFKPLMWGKDVEFKSEQEASSYTVKIKTIRGEERTILPETIQDHPWFTITFSNPAKTLVISPRPIDEALRL